MNKFLTPLGCAILGMVLAIGPAIFTYKKEMKSARKELKEEWRSEVIKELTIESRLTALETTQIVFKGDIYDNQTDIKTLQQRHSKEGE